MRRTPVLAKSLLAVLATFSVAGIAGAFSLGVPGRAWPGGKARVCWSESAAAFKEAVPALTVPGVSSRYPTADERDFVRRVVLTAFGRERVGIGFTGFEACAAYGDDEPVQAHLLFDVELGRDVAGSATPGEYGTGASWINRIESFFTGNRAYSGLALSFSTMTRTADESARATRERVRLRIPPSRRSDPALASRLGEYAENYRADALKFTVIHEFGHLAGLLHEERRSDFAQESPAFCPRHAADLLLENSGSDREKRFETEFDPFSVMNYCRDVAQKRFHQARLVCDLGPEIRAGVAALGQDPALVDRVLEKCDFIRANPFRLELSPRDVTALRAMYLGEAPRPGVATGYKHSETEREWVEVFNRVSRLHL